MNPSELHAKLYQRIKSLEVLQKRVDIRALVLADLRERKPVIVVRGFKWEGQIIQAGDEFLPDPEFIPLVAQQLESLEYRRAFTTKEMIEGRRKHDELEKIADQLAPLVAAVSKYRSQASQARATEAAARQAMEASRREAAEAEKNLTSADGALKNYMGTLTIEI
jgi:hypothetical protein